MFRRPRLVLALLLASFTFSAAHAADAPSPSIIGAYYPGDSATRYPIAQIPADKLTHLFYAFARIQDGQCSVAADAHAHFAALTELKRQHPRLRTDVRVQRQHYRDEFWHLLVGAMDGRQVRLNDRACAACCARVSAFTDRASASSARVSACSIRDSQTDS